MKILIVIPARYKSTRLQGKPLKKIKNKELILWVVEKCKKVNIRDKKEIIVATDNKKIANLITKNNCKFLMTSSKCLTGTDRVAEVAKKIKADIYINVQGDEPLIKPSDIQNVIAAKKKYPKKIICGYSKISKNEKADNINIPKEILNEKKELIYISRAKIPSSKEKKKFSGYFKQVCIYAFNRDELKKFQSNKKSTLEKMEDIEIIRFLEKGKKIQMVKLSSQSHAVDIPSDIIKIEKLLS